jgi:hypothetical protein
MNKKDQPSPGREDSTAVTIRLASPDDVRTWSQGEVTHADFLKDVPDRPHPQGLFSQRIFGPLLDWTCACIVGDGKAKYWGPAAAQPAGTLCPRCHVPIDRALVRRQRMGHIELAAPVVHTWFLRSRPSPLALLLGVKASAMESVADYQAHIVLDPADSGLKKGVILDEGQYRAERDRERQRRGRAGRAFQADTGGRAIQRLLPGAVPSSGSCKTSTWPVWPTWPTSPEPCGPSLIPSSGRTGNAPGRSSWPAGCEWSRPCVRAAIGRSGWCWIVCRCCRRTCARSTGWPAAARAFPVT